MHGKSSVRTWEKLGDTAFNGSSKIVLLQAVNWSINSDIVIATTGDRFSQGQSEIRRIIEISNNGSTLTLDQPLSYTYLGVVYHLNRTTIEVRSEIGLLSRNVVFQGIDKLHLDQLHGIFVLFVRLNKHTMEFNVNNMCWCFFYR